MSTTALVIILLLLVLSLTSDYKCWDTMNQSSTMAREPVYEEINKCYDLVGTEIIFYFSAVH